MKFKDTIFNRRRFLDGLFGGWLGALVASLLPPLARYLFPPEREPDSVTLPLPEFEEMAPGSARSFRWGSKPGLLMRKADGTFTAFVAVCTHLDCNVSYMPGRRRFHCACHDGWYDEDGVNIAGPPPRPLRRLVVAADGDKLTIRGGTAR